MDEINTSSSCEVPVDVDGGGRQRKSQTLQTETFDEGDIGELEQKIGVCRDWYPSRVQAHQQQISGNKDSKKKRAVKHGVETSRQEQHF